ncbi:ABC transporter substrate-binding protein [Jiella sp. M17.18]|uniref:ABC transporter substrate-binding protein n=1 Tax=Jiella sp. M17.18 TaxID=3234247 RepID=UPI0034DFE8B2
MNLTKKTGLTATALALALALPGAAALSAPAAAADAPTVTLMVGGIDKQIYLPYQLAKSLGMYKKYGVNVELSTEQNGGVGAEDAVISGQVDMAGAWYNHTIEFQEKGKDVIGIVQLSVAPGERIMCAKGTDIKSPKDWKGKSVGVTDLGSGTDALVSYVSARAGLKPNDYSKIAAGAGQTMIAALKFGKAACGITSQPTVNAIEKLGVGYSAIDLSTGAGVQKWLGGDYPAATVLVRADWAAKHKKETQGVVDALVATLEWMKTHSPADVANVMPKDFVSNQLTSKEEYVAALMKDWGQYNLDGLGTMPKSGPQTVYDIEKAAGKVHKKVDLSKTYTNQYVDAAKKKEGIK